jgi:hypothetical protein
MTAHGDIFDTFLAKIEAGTMTHDDTADLFMLTVVGQSTGLTRDQILAKLRERYATQADLIRFLRTSYASFILAVMPASSA